MPPHTTTSHLLTSLLQTFRSLTLSPKTVLPPTSLLTTSKILPPNRAFTTTTPVLAGRPGRKRPKTDPRITLIRYHLKHPITPRPLRLSRLRALRHWTIQRAWSLARRKKVEKEEGELYRMYQSMHSACEALRLLESPKDTVYGSDAYKNATSRLYRIAMEKKGVFGHGGVPIEYARMQVDTPGRQAWDHSWSR